jgi:YHS domain-containing protein
MPGNEHASCCAPRNEVGNTAVDPICQMEVDRSSPPGGSLELGGETYFFCSTFCRAKFAGARASASL